MNTLLVQSFGSEKEYRRAVFAVLSFFAQNRDLVQQFRVVICTDSPFFFKAFLKQLPVQFKQLTPQRIEDMKGKSNFLHRIKIILIQEIFAEYGGNVLYVDSDSFFTSDPQVLVQRVDTSHVFMHTHEYLFQSMKELPLPGGQPFVTFYNEVVNRTFNLETGKCYFIDEMLSSWNAGVIVIHSSYERYLEDVLELTDEFWKRTQCHACEQYAFSVVFQSVGSLGSCEEINYHYWYRTEKRVMDLKLVEFLDSNFSDDTLDYKLNKVRGLTKVLNGLIKSHSIVLRDVAIQAFNTNQWKDGYLYAFKAMRKDPFDLQFLRDVLYHSKRRFLDAFRN
jgi:hypothetical protein